MVTILGAVAAIATFSYSVFMNGPKVVPYISFYLHMDGSKNVIEKSYFFISLTNNRKRILKNVRIRLSFYDVSDGNKKEIPGLQSYVIQCRDIPPLKTVDVDYVGSIFLYNYVNDHSNHELVKKGRMKIIMIVSILQRTKKETVFELDTMEFAPYPNEPLS